MSNEKDDSWKMPQPVFRSSTGSLQRSLEETISHSFMPNAETIEIDADDDILSIMDTPYRSEPPRFSDHSEDEEPLEIGHGPIPETETPSESEAKEDAHKPIVVTAKEPDEKFETAAGSSKSNMVIFVIFVLIAAALVGAYLYNLYQPPTSP